MRISVLIPSRGRSLSLMETVLTMHGRVSRLRDVRYVIGCDAGDDDTIAMALSLRKGGLPVVPHIGDRPSSLGGLVNKLAERCPADVYCSLGDDVRVVTDNWDSAIADAWCLKPDGVWWWSSPSEVLFAIVSEQWRAAAGRIFTDYFPFWYDDIWLAELLRYAHGRVGGERLNVWLEDRAPGTHRMRDLAFWDEFFWSRREERKAEARAIVDRLGWSRVESFDGLDVAKNPAFDAAAIAKIEAGQGERRPPTPEYLAAYERAKAMMQKEAA
jgi:hypothetical protein